MKVSELMTREVLQVGREASLDEAMERMDTGDVRHLPVVEDGRVVGMLSERDLLEVTGWLPPRVREVLDAPSGTVGDFMHSPVVSVSPQDSIVTASLRLLEWKIGCLPVLDDGVLVGLVSESDVLGAYVRACRNKSIPRDMDPDVEEYMTTEIELADHGMEADEALEICRSKQIRHLPIQEDDELMGIVSDRDLRLLVGRGQLEGTKLGDLPLKELVTAECGTRLSNAAALLVHHRIGALPVVEGRRLLGLVSSADVLAHCSRAFAKRVS